MPPELLPLTFPGGRLRRLRATDLVAFQAYRALPDLGRYQGWTPMPDQQALAFLEEMSRAPLFARGQWMQIGIADASSDRLVGDMGLHLSDDGATGEVGFTLSPTAQGRGIATLAVREALRLLVVGTQVSAVLGITDARNGPSIRLLKRVGFRHLETREAIFRGEPCTEMAFELKRSAMTIHTSREASTMRR